MTGEDPAVYLASRIRARYRLSTPPTLTQLVAIARELGAAVVIVPGLARPGYYVPWPIPAILLRPRPSARVLAHEIYHHLVSDNAAHGVIYGYPDFAEGPEEEAAERFAGLLCRG